MATLRERLSAADLELRLHTRCLHPELYDVVAERTLTCDGLEARVRLIDNGHIVELAHPRGCVTESAAAKTAENPRAGLVNTFPFRGERTRMFAWRNGVRYSVSLQAEQLAPPHYRKVHDELMRVSPTALVHRFSEDPSAPERPVAFSVLEFELRRGELLVQAFHAFPEELTLLKTQSLFEVRDFK